VGKANQTIIFGALASKTVSDAPFNLTATASSGLTITYASTNTAVATVSGSTVTIVGAGTTTITASQAGNTNYNAAPDVSQNLVIEATNIEINVPSVFTPNGDGNNDRLRVIASVSPTSIDFKVFNNLQQVYRTTNVSEALNQGWDGAGVPSNKLLAYQLTYTFAGQRFTKRGIVTLIR
jgi:gliding motility-associated-like protein